MTILDWVLVVVWAGITLGGFWKGAIRIVFGLGGLALGIWLAVVVGDDLTVSLAGTVENEWLALGIAYLTPVVVVSGLCLLAGWGMEKTLEAFKLGCLNRVLGAGLAGVAAALVLALLLVTAVGISPEVARFEERSILLEKVRSTLGLAMDVQDADTPAATGEPAADKGSSSGR